MEIGSNNSAIPYIAAGSRPQASGTVAKPAMPPDSPSTIVSLQQHAPAQPQADDSMQPSPVKSFAYGALGLPEPLPTEEQPAKPGNTYFAAGKWVAAAATVGSIVSLLV